VAEEKADKLREKVAAMKAKLKELKALEETVSASPNKQVSLTDPDARAMSTSLKASGVVGYNVQAAGMAMKTKAAFDADEITVFADRGYFSGEQIKDCVGKGVTPFVPKPYTSNSKAAGRFGKYDFTYDPDEDAYHCPAGEKLTYRYTNVEAGRTLKAYWTNVCGNCPIKAKCTTGKERRVRRWEHEDIIDDMLRRLDAMPDAMAIRRRTVEHPFGTLKSWMGPCHLLTKGLEKVSTEISLSVLAHNLKRMISIMGVKPLITAIQA